MACYRYTCHNCGLRFSCAAERDEHTDNIGDALEGCERVDDHEGMTEREYCAAVEDVCR